MVYGAVPVPNPIAFHVLNLELSSRQHVIQYAVPRITVIAKQHVAKEFVKQHVRHVKTVRKTVVQAVHKFLIQVRVLGQGQPTVIALYQVLQEHQARVHTAHGLAGQMSQVVHLRPTHAERQESVGQSTRVHIAHGRVGLTRLAVHLRLTRAERQESVGQQVLVRVEAGLLGLTRLAVHPRLTHVEQRESAGR